LVVLITGDDNIVIEPSVVRFDYETLLESTEITVLWKNEEESFSTLSFELFGDSAKSYTLN